MLSSQEGLCSMELVLDVHIKYMEQKYEHGPRHTLAEQRVPEVRIFSIHEQKPETVKGNALEEKNNGITWYGHVFKIEQR
jgi:hypothetical protein